MTIRFNFLTDLCGIHYPDNEVETIYNRISYAQLVWKQTYKNQNFY
jgi:hypothetical protein